MLHYIHILIFSGLLLLSSCSEKKQVEWLDSNQWIEECNYRQSNYVKIIKNQKELIGLRVEELEQILGAPDRLELGERGEKGMIYEIDCDSSAALKSHIKIWHNSLGNVRQVYLQFENN